MPKITTPKKHNKSVDIFDFNDSVADFETFHTIQKTYTTKRKSERSDSLSKFDSAFVLRNF